MMNDHQQQTDFLTQCLLYDDTAESRNLAQRIARVQQDYRRVQCGLRLMGGLAGLAVVGLCYSAIFLAYYPQNVLGFTTNFITQVFCVLGLVSTICLLVFAFLGLAYRKQLNQRREECRQLVTKVLECRMGKPAAATLQNSRVSGGAGGAIRNADAANGPLGKIESTARG